VRPDVQLFPAHLFVDVLHVFDVLAPDVHFFVDDDPLLDTHVLLADRQPDGPAAGVALQGAFQRE
jgi:hypothetical protein